MKLRQKQELTQRATESQRAQTRREKTETGNRKPKRRPGIEFETVDDFRDELRVSTG